MKHLFTRFLTGLVVALALSVLTVMPAFANSNCEESNNGVCEQEKPESTVILSSNLEDNFDVKALALLSDEERVQLKEKLTGLLGQPELFKQVVNDVRGWLQKRLKDQERFDERLLQKKESLEWDDKKVEKYKAQFDNKVNEKTRQHFESLMTEKKKYYYLQQQYRYEAPGKKPYMAQYITPPTTNPDEGRAMVLRSIVKDVSNHTIYISKFGATEKLLINEKTVLVQISANGVASNITIEAFQPGDRVFSLINTEQYMPHVGTAVVVVRMLN